MKMKKTLLTLTAALVGTFAFAQKPVMGSKTAEVVLNLQTGTSGISYNLPGELRLRYFMADKMAIRARIGLGSTSSTDKVSNAAGTTTAEIKKSSGFDIMLAPGIEKHFAGTSKLSPYYGAQLMFGYSTGASTEVSNANNPTPTTGSVNSGDSYKSTDGSNLGLGLGLLLGADYYVTDGIFVGGEMGLGLFNMTSAGDGTEKVNSDPETKTLGGSTFDLFGVTTGGVRLGFRF
jgi:hypothetical protein